MKSDIKRKKRKILLISFHSLLFRHGGVSTYIETLLSHLDYEVKIITLFKKGDLKEKKGIDNEICLGIKRILPGLCIIGPKSLFSLIKYIKEAEIVHFNPIKIWELFPFFLSVIMKKKTVTTYHGNFIETNYFLFKKIGWPVEYLRLRILYSLFVPFSTKNIFLTSSQKEKICNFLPKKIKNSSKNVVIPNFLNENFISLKKRRLKKNLKFLFVGRLTREKGFKDLIKISNKTKILLSFAGEGKPINQDNKNLSYLGILGREEIKNTYDDNDILILPSYTEAFPMVILEAMARGLVILVSDIPGMREIIKEKRNGYFFLPGDVEKIEKIVTYLRSNPKEVKRISENNLKDIQKFTAKKQITKYIQLYESVLKDIQLKNENKSQSLLFLNLKKKRILVSIVIPVFNREKTIKRALSSAANQTYENTEIIVIDDGSTDKTAEIVKNFSKKVKKGKIKYFYQKNKGASAARNLGVLKAKGDYLSFLDSDDEYLPEKIERHLSKALQYKSDFSICNEIQMRDNFFYIKNKIKKEKITLSFNSFIEKFLSYSTISTLIKRDVFLEYMFDERLKAFEDTDLILRYLKKNNIVLIKDVLVKIYKSSKEPRLSSDPKARVGGLNEMIFKLNRGDYGIEEESLKNKLFFTLYCQVGIYNILGKNYKEARKGLIMAGKTKNVPATKKARYFILSIFLLYPPFMPLVVYFGKILWRLRIVEAK
ncbi:MAG: glycosyltransferase [Candidatus Pacebacteria bacterium]|nr:glycosyltransferase [Candidatus Paceibacterota bacterium]